MLFVGALFKIQHYPVLMKVAISAWEQRLSYLFVRFAKTTRGGIGVWFIRNYKECMVKKKPKKRKKEALPSSWTIMLKKPKLVRIDGKPCSRNAFIK